MAAPGEEQKVLAAEAAIFSKEQDGKSVPNKRYKEYLRNAAAYRQARAVAEAAKGAWLAGTGGQADLNRAKVAQDVAYAAWRTTDIADIEEAVVYLQAHGHPLVTFDADRQDMEDANGY